MRPVSAGRLALLCLAFLPPQGVRADDTFYKSDEYQDGEAVVSVFLQAPEYRLMVEDLERNGTGFDWGWVLTAQRPTDPAPQEGGKLKRMLRRFDTELKTEVLGFALSDYRTVSVPDVKNFAGIAPKGQLAEIRSAFLEAVTALGLETVDDPATADLEIGLALVDQLRTEINVPVYNIDVKPHIELELRLLDKRTGQNLLLVRHRRHGSNHEEAALNFADDLVKFLR